ncbi:muscle M-line assembly protein unc-89 isoform X2 [Apis cerana]|uniref:muscle M-line assembly protein unc-89 isoform X2 n=1 Tax=Apis cerana TaxID=7461 RepID=UPI002B23A2E6|nr:muscle M-line assembly protein unc-89 isoform X2 [Apis cerana]
MGNATTKSHYSKSQPLAATRRPRWEGSGLPAPPGKPILIPGADESQPDVVAIRWERSPSNGGSAIVGYLVEHRRLGSQHWVRSTSGLCTFPELTLSGLEPGWRYQFRVRAQNAVGLSRPSEISDPLTVTLQRSVASAPQFDLEVKDTTVFENEQAEFVVRFTGSPLPKIAWFKDGFEIFSSRRTRIITESGKSVLLIHQTALNDEGEIKCTATNRAGHASTKARLILEAPPKIRLPRQYEDGLLFEQDETIRLKVSLAGRPPPSVIWYHDGEVVLTDERHVFESMDGESILKIPDAKRVDRGEYVVKAINKLGEDTSSFLVTVTDRPAAPGKATVTMTLGRSVSLTWQEPEDDGGCKIGTYIVEYYRIGWDVWLKATTSRQTKATLSELIEGSEYKFRVKAENPYGVSEPSEESDVIFIPDLKRGIVAPLLSGKSQSQREIRSREKREVSFAVPTQRTRSLTREEARDDDIFGPASRSISAQRLTGRPSRADSRVTFALDTMDKSKPPIPPARSKDHSSSRHENQVGNHVDRSTINTNLPNIEVLIQNKEPPSIQIPLATVTVTPPTIEESNKRSAFRESRSRSVSMSRERSMSPLSMPKIQEQHEEETFNYSRPSLSLTSKKQQADEIEIPRITKSDTLYDKLGLPISPREDDVTVMHGSSEFMLVLYPEDQAKKVDDTTQKDLEAKQGATEGAEDIEDLIPPPMSLSLPELFSAEHQVVETLREAVSSTELLHERAMERFYRAVAAEEASELAKRKSQLERRTGELATTIANKTGAEDISDSQRSSFKRRLSNPNVPSSNLITWQSKNRRRLSDSQTETVKAPQKLLTPTTFLLDVEARSDPNIPSDSESPIATQWGLENKPILEDTPLRRWHDTNVSSLVEEEKSIAWQSANNEGVRIEEPPRDQIQPTQQSQPGTRREEEEKEEEEEEEESIESSEESSEEISSADSEDLKLLKARILARQVLDEEDTYHPRGKPILHVETEPSSQPIRSIALVSPSTVVPKSILKKPKEEPIPVNSFGRPIPPEKPIRRSLPPNVHPLSRNEQEEEASEERQVTPEPARVPVMSESDTDSVLSAGEAAKNRRIQAKMRTATPEEEVDEEDIEARMAVVNHYTEIVREHSSLARYHNYRNSEERRQFGEIASTGSRRSSISDDQETSNQGRDRFEGFEVSGRQENVEGRKRVEERQQTKVVAGSRGTTPARDTKEKRSSRPSSRNQSPVSRSRNVSTERGGVSSRSSSKSRVRAPSQDRRPPSRTGSEEQRSVREWSVEEGRSGGRSRRSSSKTPSRSNSRDRNRAGTPVESKMERLQKALESKRYRSYSRRGSSSRGREYQSEKGWRESRLNEEQLAIEAKHNVRSTVEYITDLTLLLAAVYVYLFKKETLAIPFIALLFYRRIQHEIKGRVSKGWWSSKRNS